MVDNPTGEIRLPGLDAKPDSDVTIEDVVASARARESRARRDPNRPRRQYRRRSQVNSEAPSSRASRPIEIAADIADAGSGRPSKATPSADEWGKYLERALVYLSVGYVYYLTDGGDNNVMPEDERDAMELDDERADHIAKPFSRLIARTTFNKRHGRDVLDNFDVLPATIAIATYIADTKPLRQAKRARRAQQRAQQGQRPRVIPFPGQPRAEQPQPEAKTQEQASEPRPSPNGAQSGQPAGGFQPGAQHSID